MTINRRRAVVLLSDPSRTGKAFYPAIVGDVFGENEFGASIVDIHLLDYSSKVAYPDACLAFAALTSGEADRQDAAFSRLPWQRVDTEKVYEEISILTTELDVLARA